MVDITVLKDPTKTDSAAKDRATSIMSDATTDMAKTARKEDLCKSLDPTTMSHLKSLQAVVCTEEAEVCRTGAALAACEAEAEGTFRCVVEDVEIFLSEEATGDEVMENSEVACVETLEEASKKTETLTRTTGKPQIDSTTKGIEEATGEEVETLMPFPIEEHSWSRILSFETKT